MGPHSISRESVWSVFEQRVRGEPMEYREVGGEPIHNLVEAQARRSPKAIALVDGQYVATYEELDHQSNGVAQLLKTKGVEPRQLVGIYAERSAKTVAGILGILKTGAAYMPIDPDLPAARVDRMIQQAGLDTVVSAHPLHRDDLGASCTLVSMDTALPAEVDAHRCPGVCVPPSDIAYALQTSGSTGRPKIVLCSHEAATNLLEAIQRIRPIGLGDRASLWTSLSFDVSVYEIFSALAYGVTLYIAPPSIRASGRTFVEWLCDNMITSCYLPPFAISDLYDWVGVHQFNVSLRRLLVGVEPIRHALLAGIANAIEDVVIINGYGPTETTICATIHIIDPSIRKEGFAPIGKPIPNTYVHILDDGMMPVKKGTIGELYVGGIGLAQGYLNQPQLTEERFVRDPFPREQSGRLYRTGDLVRSMEDGTLEFRGRVDDQLKIRGYRIEPAEIEEALLHHQGIRELVVDTTRGPHEEMILVAYIVPKHDLLYGSDLRDFLTDKLPQYMIPTQFVLLDKLPRNSRDKIDRSRLPRGQDTSYSPRSVLPMTHLQHSIANSWKVVLHVDEIGLDDNFFDAGGTSLLLKSLQEALSNDCAVDIPDAVMLENPTIRELAKAFK